MGRVSNEQATRNRQTVVEASSRLLRAKGINGAGIRELMAAAGMTQGAFTRQFASKEALAAEACALAFEGAERAFRATLQDTSPGQSRRLVDDYLCIKSLDQACPIATLAIDASRAGKDSAFRKTFAEGLERIARLVEGDPPSSDRLVLLAAMIGAVILRGSIQDVDVTARMEAAIKAFSDTVV